MVTHRLMLSLIQTNPQSLRIVNVHQNICIFLVHHHHHLVGRPFRSDTPLSTRLERFPCHPPR
ncbi:hypothetical protein BDR03DRAFT_940961 [Suillus americanus]|nr:hypothetical protein BDR03DRAFT_940961 [Suillus americanus]